MSAEATDYKVGLINDEWVVYHRERDPFAKWGTRRVVDIWCASQRVAERLRDEMQEFGEVQP